MYKMKFGYLTLLILLSQSAFSQGWLGKDLSNINVKELTNAQRDEVKRSARLQGLNDADMEAIARSRGMSLDDFRDIRSNDGEKIGKKDKDTSTSKRQEVSENVLQTTVAIYGQELFENSNLDFLPSSNLAPTAGYILGPNDHLDIRIYGLQEQNMKVVVATNGSIVIPYGGKIMVSGLTLAQAERTIINQLKKVGFASLGNGNSQLKIQITEFRTIQVMVWGAKQSGAYYLPSLATGFHALFASGGPGLNRSYRNIHIIRNGKTIRVIDLYEFLAKGSRASDITLQDNDIVFIPYYDRRVRLRGEIKTPAVFELLPNEHLQSAITYAGGYTEIAYQEVVEVLRYGGAQKELFTVRAEELADFKLLGSEIVTVSSIMDRYSNRVKVDGAVERPGYYSMADGIDLKKAIENAGGLKPSAIKEYVLLFREPRDGQNHYYAYRLDSILAGNMRIELQENDMILVGDSLDMNREDKVHIYGDVNKQGEYLFGAGITVSKLLFLAGGFEQEALTSKIIISRKVEDETQLATVNVLSARRDFWNDKALNEFVLKPGDVVTVSRNPYYREQVYVTCEGEFKVPGVYPMASRNQSLYDIYMQAGGSNQYGNVDGSILIRQRKIQISTAKIEFLKAKVLNELYAQDTLKEADELNYKPDSLVIDTIVIGGYRNFETTAKSFYLQPGDRFIIPTIESTVSILGEVYNPNVIMYDKKLTLKRYIIMAGGTTEEAKKNNIFVVYSNGRSAKTRRFLGVFKLRPAIRPGCQIIVPSKSKGNDANSRLSATERITMYSVMASTMSSLAYLISQIVK